MFYAASSILAFGLHLGLEPWVTPSWDEWLVIAGMGLLPMGLAIYFWDFGVKRGDIQALGVFSYSEPFIGALLVALVAHANLRIELLWSGALVVAGAIVASAGLWRGKSPAEFQLAQLNRPVAAGHSPDQIRRELELLGNRLLERLIQIGVHGSQIEQDEAELRGLLATLKLTMSLWDEVILMEEKGLASDSLSSRAAQPRGSQRAA